ncbi:MAG: hypothetical protein AAB847_01685 [Patescibacteria group bacterium]
MQFFKVIHLSESAIPDLIKELRYFQIPFNFELAKEIAAEKPCFYLSLPKNFNLKQFPDWKKYLIPSHDHSIFYPQGVHLVNFLKPKNSNSEFKIINLKFEIPNRVGDGYAVQYCFKPTKENHELNIRAVTSSKNFSGASELLFQVTAPFAADFKIINPRAMSEGIVDYTHRNFQEKYKFLLGINNNEPIF